MLHPTPAVGGEPWPQAAGAIADLEGMDRGWYAGPVGWMDATEDGEFCVALRSALLRDREAHLFAGVGVVAGSDPAAELAETEVKLQALLPLLGRVAVVASGEHRRSNSGEAPAMVSRCLAVGLGLLAALVPGSAVAEEAPPAGPRLAMVSLTEVKRKHERERDPSKLSLQTFGPPVRQRRLLLRVPLEPAGGAIGPMPFSGPRWSADGRLLVFAGSSGKARQIYVIGADGGKPRPVAGTSKGSEPVSRPTVARSPSPALGSVPTSTSRIRSRRASTPAPRSGSATSAAAVRAVSTAWRRRP